MEDMMLDIETMSVNPTNALILSIGMVEFNPRQPRICEIGRNRLIVLDIREQLVLGRAVDSATQKFWADSKMSEARKHWCNPEVPLASVRDACNQITDFWHLCEADWLWSNGIVFDVGNVDSLFRSIGAEPPWKYNAPRDVRTFCKETPALRTPSEVRGQVGSVAHEPISDCIDQADWVWSHIADEEESKS